MKYIIFDLDGCISDDRHRRHLLPDDENASVEAYDEYHKLLWKDNVLNENVIYHAVNVCREDKMSIILFITARPKKFNTLTRHWFGARFGSFQYLLLMRPDGNCMPTAELKLWLIDQASIPRNEIHMAYDDHEDVIYAYRQAGFPCELLDEKSSTKASPKVDDLTRLGAPAAAFTEAHEELLQLIREKLIRSSINIPLGNDLIKLTNTMRRAMNEVIANEITRI